MPDDLTPLKTGSAVPDTCTPVDHLPTAALKDEDGLIAEAVGEDAVIDDEDVPTPIKKGMLFLAERRQQYMDAFAELGLTVCEEVGQISGNLRSFCQELDVLRLSIGPGGGLQVFLTGRDTVDVGTAGAYNSAMTTYWPAVLSQLIASANARDARRVDVVQVGYFSGHTSPEYTSYIWQQATRPAGGLFYYYLLDHPVRGDGVTPFFAGQGPAQSATSLLPAGPGATPDTTAVVLLGSAFDRFGPGAVPFSYQTAWAQAMFAFSRSGNAPLLRMLKAGCSFMALSQVYHDPNAQAGGAGPTDGIWRVGSAVVPGFLLADPDGGDVYVARGQETSGQTPSGQNYAFTDDGEAQFPGLEQAMQCAAGQQDSSQSRFDITDEEKFAAWGLKVFATQNAGSYNIDIGGHLTARYFSDMEELLGITL